MTTVDLGTEALGLLRQSLGVGDGWTLQPIGAEPSLTPEPGSAVHWPFWGALQRAWAEPLAVPGGPPTWRLQLRTRVLEGFTGSPRQITALLANLPHASLAGIVPAGGPRQPVELASAVDVHDGNLESMVRLLRITARAQAVDARHLFSWSKQLESVGLVAIADEAADQTVVCLRPGEIRWDEPASGREGVAWTAREVAMCTAALQQGGEWHATEKPWGISVTFTLDQASAVRSVLEVRRGVARPLAGRGVSVTLWTPVGGGLLDAMAWNERELIAVGPGVALGGWWVSDRNALVHRSFYPTEVWHPDLVAELLRSSMHRAHTANASEAPLQTARTAGADKAPPR